MEILPVLSGAWAERMPVGKKKKKKFFRKFVAVAKDHGNSRETETEHGQKRIYFL